MRSVREDEHAATDRPWVTIVWDDPINLMSYVTYVFQQLFGFPKSKAEKLMLDVHQHRQGRGHHRHPRGDGARRHQAARRRAVGDPDARLLTGTHRE